MMSILCTIILHLIRYSYCVNHSKCQNNAQNLLCDVQCFWPPHTTANHDVFNLYGIRVSNEAHAAQ